MTSKWKGSSTSFGTALRAARKSQRLSVSALAEKANVSVGMISQIERDVANPSLKIMEKLRNALNVPLSALLEPYGAAHTDGTYSNVLAERLVVRREGDRPVLKVGAALTKELLSPVGAEGLRFMTISVPPHASPFPVVREPGQKAGLILQGTVHLTVDHSEFVLRSGDSFQFNSELDHSMQNRTDEPARLIWIVVSYETAHL